MKWKGMKWSLKSGPAKPFQNIEFSLMDREWDRNRSFVRIRFRRPTSAQLSRALKADEISVVEPTQPLRLVR